MDNRAIPLVSFLMVARDAGLFVDDAILTARRQTLERIEIVVVDDGSRDDTRAIAQRHAAADARVRVLDAPCTGLADVRNASLAAARGRWAAILDSDDMVHPRHLEWLVASAEATGATVTAANMVSFGVDVAGVRHASLFADVDGWRAERNVDLADYVLANSAAAGDSVSAGYLKPLFDMAFLRRHALTYDRRLRIAEDYDLVARILSAGGSFRYLPRPTYFYRRHATSTSSRLTPADLTGMISAADSALAGPAVTPAVRAAVARRLGNLYAALAHAHAIDALKARRPRRALAALGISPAPWRMMANTVIEAVAKRVRRLRLATVNGGAGVLLIGDGTFPGPHVRRAIAVRGQEAMITDALPPIDRIVLGEGASVDDAAYALSPHAELVTDRSQS